jgi:hypothetical protein
VLLDATQDANLLVVGSRGHRGFAGLLLGSVSHHVVDRADCPVVVVPTGRERFMAASSCCRSFAADSIGHRACTALGRRLQRRGGL